jgi:hypothetical protein
MSASNHSIAAAIVIAGAMIAAAIYLGLRTTQPAPAPPTPRPAPPALSLDEVTREAIAALAYHRPELVSRCYPPGERTPTSFMLNVTFDAQGSQLALGIEELPGTSTTAISNCIANHLPTLTVPPPGRQTRVEIPLQLP